MPTLLFIAGIVLGTVLVPGGTPPPSTNGTAASPLLLNGSTNGSTIAVPLTTLTLELAENPTTGYSWNLTPTAGLRVAGDEYIPAATGAGIVGAGGVHRWRIVAVATGPQEIRGVYARPWENSTADATTYSVAVSITP